MKPTSILLTLLISLLMMASALPALAERTKMRRTITFIVRKADKVRNIAARFHIPAKELTRLNAHLRKGQMVYAGKQLRIPVWLQRISNSEKESSDFTMKDYVLAHDSLDDYINEDFVNTADIEADTVRRAVIDREIRGLDKKLSILYVRYDSVLRVENAEAADLSLREQKKLLIARMRNNPHAWLNTAIDTLNKQKATLINEKSSINARVDDYENLIENASYAAAHPEEANQKAFSLNEWGDDPAKITAAPVRTKSKK